MKRSSLPLVFGLASTLHAQGAPVRDFRIEAAHSHVAFSIGFLGFPVRGRFDEVRGTIAYVPGRLEESSVTAVIPVREINTGSQHRDAHLRSADFFDAERYPNIMFRSTAMTRSTSGLVMSGDLTIRGVTRRVVMPLREVQPPIEEPHGSTLLTFSTTLRIDRRDFGVLGGSRFNDWFKEVRRATMADTVEITIDIQGRDPDYTRDRRYDAGVAKVQRVGADSVARELRARRRANPDALAGGEWEIGQIAKALLVRGDSTNALGMYRLNTELFPRSSGVHAALAAALERLGRRGEARSTAERALTIDSTDTLAAELLRRLR